jgi:hypothetical protein
MYWRGCLDRKALRLLQADGRATLPNARMGHGVLLRPLPSADPDRLVAIWESNAGQREAHAGTSAPTLRMRAVERGRARTPAWSRASANLFSLRGVAALTGGRS